MIFTLCDYFKALKSDKHAAATLLLLMICQSFNGAVLQTFKQLKNVKFVVFAFPQNFVICSIFFKHAL